MLAYYKLPFPGKTTGASDAAPVSGYGGLPRPGEGQMARAMPIRLSGVFPGRAGILYAVQNKFAAPTSSSLSSRARS